MHIRVLSARGPAVWVVGYCQNGDTPVACVAHYTGSQWVRVAVPTQFKFFGFDAVLAFANTNVVAGGGFGRKSALIRWNGKTWSCVHDVPYQGGTVGIAGTLSNHLFSAGTATKDPAYGTFEHEQPNGSRQLAQAFAPRSQATAISASSAENAWVVGISFDPTTDVWNPVAMRWNGTAETTVNVASGTSELDLWGVVTTPRPHLGGGSLGWRGVDRALHGRISFTQLAAPNGDLLGIAAVPGDESDLWAVGAGGGNQPVIMHHAP
jgi:hypothetical protein